MTSEVHRFEHAGLTCYIMKMEPLGHLCGYVVLPHGHPWHGKSYGNVDIDDIDVHGGVTFGQHVPDDGDGSWTLGFDAAHFGDYVPGLARHGVRGELRDVDYMTAECIKLAEQAKTEGDETRQD